MYGILYFLESQFSRGEFWTGLVNPNNEVCFDGDCVNKLKWDSDGSYLDSWADTSHGFGLDQGDDCLRYRDTSIGDHPCDRTYYYICEFQCPTTTTTTITSTFSKGKTYIYVHLHLHYITQGCA